jgi:hypothetical protein
MNKTGSVANQVDKWLADLQHTHKVPFKPFGGRVYIFTWKGFPKKKGKYYKLIFSSVALMALI